MTTPAVPPEMPEELVERCVHMAGGIDYDPVARESFLTRCSLSQFRAAVSLAFRAGMERQMVANASARACAEWLAVVAGVLPCLDESKEDGCGDPECPQCVAFKLCEPWFKDRKQFEKGQP